jgi:flagellar FliJ protein
MVRSKRIQPIVDLAENRQMDAARKLGQSRKVLERHQQRLTELVAYREEYSRHFDQGFKGGMGVMKLNEYRSFLSRLDEAIGQQRELVEQARRDCDHSRQGWLQTRTRSQALDKVKERYLGEERREAERVEQKITDEHAGRPRRA